MSKYKGIMYFFLVLTLIIVLGSNVNRKWKSCVPGFSFDTLRALNHSHRLIPYDAAKYMQKPH